MKIKRTKQNRKVWHKRFAWLPTKVDDTEKDYGVVWFEHYFRKEGMVKGSWVKHSKGEWMRKKLAGDFDKPNTFTDTGSWIPGSSSTSTIVSGGGISATPTYTFVYDTNTGIVKSEEDIEDTQMKMDFVFEADNEDPI